jgi:hypothetical protein
VVVVVVVVGLGLSAAALCGGVEEQALSTSPAIPADVSAPQANERRARVRCASGFVISAA